MIFFTILKPCHIETESTLLPSQTNDHDYDVKIYGYYGLKILNDVKIPNGLKILKGVKIPNGWTARCPNGFLAAGPV